MTYDISITKLTGVELMREACGLTIDGESRASLSRMYRAEHSPIRTQLFWVVMRDIPTFVSVHLVRHKIGVEHFVKSNREDRGGDKTADRNTPVNHGMLINAAALIFMARKRLCHQASKETKAVMEQIREEIRKIDPDLADHMVPDCQYRKCCPEPKPCGKMK